jgi:hypothetical protein
MNTYEVEYGIFKPAFGAMDYRSAQVSADTVEDAIEDAYMRIADSEPDMEMGDLIYCRRIR